MNYDALKTDYDSDGFVVVRDFVTGDALAELRQNLDRYISEIVPTLPETHAFYQDRSRPETLKQLQFMCVDPYFSEFMENAHWRRLALALLGEEIGAVMEPEWFNKPPNTVHLTPPHQDNFYFCWRPPSVVTIWLALEDVDEGNGCLRYVRGSHTGGVRPHVASTVLGFSQTVTDYGPEYEAREVMVELRAGDAVAHHGNTIHRADQNRSTTRHRPAFALVVTGVSAEKDAEAQVLYEANKARHKESLPD
ncbi:MAG: phytanoyl-CoA dioxygenase family protein [Lentisphaeria bacterium]|jgi:phytanoyl-CoA hydroxylase|nr:phytanoyl-CoA dioxygenase family protein [Lentisphaeria bacterium]